MTHPIVQLFERLAYWNAFEEKTGRIGGVSAPQRQTAVGIKSLLFLCFPFLFSQVGVGGNHTLSAVDLTYTIQIPVKGSKVGPRHEASNQIS